MTINKLDDIKIVFYDFDGVMTNNKVFINQNGVEMVQVNRADGLAVAEIKDIGIEQIILSTETNSVVNARANKLGISCLYGVINKKEALLEYVNKANISIKHVAFIGNDLNDKAVMELVGHSFCPADAHECIKSISDNILKTKGGNGVIRELMDILIKIKE